MNFTKFVLFLLVAAGIGFGLFSFWAYRSASIFDSNQNMAWREFNQIIADNQVRPAILGRDEFGKVTRRIKKPDLPVPSPTKLRVVAFVFAQKKLIRADIPFWFFRLKGPFVNIALRETDFDIRSLGITAGEMAEYGAGIVIDEHRRNGDRILVWLE